MVVCNLHLMAPKIMSKRNFWAASRGWWLAIAIGPCGRVWPRGVSRFLAALAKDRSLSMSPFLCVPVHMQNGCEVLNCARLLDKGQFASFSGIPAIFWPETIRIWSQSIKIWHHSIISSMLYWIVQDFLLHLKNGCFTIIKPNLNMDVVYLTIISWEPWIPWMF